MANGELGLVVGREPFGVGPLLCGGACERGGREGVSRILEGICPLGLAMEPAGPVLEWGAGNRPAPGRPHDPADHPRSAHRIPHPGPAQPALCGDGRSGGRSAPRHGSPYYQPPPDSRLLRRHAARKPHGVVRGRGPQGTAHGGGYNHGADRTVATSVFLCGEGFSQPEAGLLEADLRRGEKASFALVGIVCTRGLRRPVERIGTAGDLRRAERVPTNWLPPTNGHGTRCGKATSS